MKSEAQQNMSCCPREQAPAKHCPRSSNVQICPLYATEGKIGIAKDRFVLAGLPATRIVVDNAAIMAAPPTAGAPALSLDGSDTYLRHRVLRI